MSQKKDLYSSLNLHVSWSEKEHHSILSFTENLLLEMVCLLCKPYLRPGSGCGDATKGRWTLPG